MVSLPLGIEVLLRLLRVIRASLFLGLFLTALTVAVPALYSWLTLDPSWHHLQRLLLRQILPAMGVGMISGVWLALKGRADADGLPEAKQFMWIATISAALAFALRDLSGSFQEGSGDVLWEQLIVWTLGSYVTGSLFSQSVRWVARRGATLPPTGSEPLVVEHWPIGLEAGAANASSSIPTVNARIHNRRSDEA